MYSPNSCFINSIKLKKMLYRYPDGDWCSTKKKIVKSRLNLEKQKKKCYKLLSTQAVSVNRYNTCLIIRLDEHSHSRPLFGKGYTFIHIDIRNCGRGINCNARERLFELFY